MSSFLTKRIFSSSSSSSSSPFHYLHRHQLALLTPLLLRHSLSTQPHQQQVKELPFIAHYLISSFGFSPDRALKYSANSHLTAIKSSERPDSVITFLKDTGLSHDQIQAAVSFHPRVLGCNVEKTLKPKVRELMNAGFSGELLVHLIRYNPAALYLKDTLSRLLFWRNFVGNNDHVLLKTIQRNTLLFNHDIDKHILPHINLLKEYELSNGDIVSFMMNGTKRCFSQNLDSLRQTLELIEELGILRGSRMFLCGLKAIGGFRNDQIKRKMKFLMETYGWSEEEVYAAFRKFPQVLVCSEDKVKLNMDFLIRKAGFESRSIALQPVLLGYSVQRVLIPRYTVLSALQAKGLKIKCSLFSACKQSERTFLERYVARYEKDMPGLREAYAAAYNEKALKLIGELGISRGSRMFLCALKAIGCYSKDKIKRNVKFLMVTYGWSEEEVCAAFRKYPKILAHSEDKVKSNMDFLISKVGFQSRDIALQPVLLGCSVQRVLIPRYTVLSALQAKGLKKKCSLLNACVICESNFIKRYVVPYEKDVPGLGQAYVDAFD